MAERRYITFQDFLKVRGISHAQLAKQAKLSVKTIDRWCSFAVGRKQLLKMKKAGIALGIDVDTVHHLLRNHREARAESASLRGLRYAIAVLDHLTESDLQDEGTATRMLASVRLSHMYSLVDELDKKTIRRTNA